MRFYAVARACVSAFPGLRVYRDCTLALGLAAVTFCINPQFAFAQETLPEESVTSTPQATQTSTPELSTPIPEVPTPTAGISESEIPTPQPQGTEEPTATPDFFSDLENLPTETPSIQATTTVQPEITSDQLVVGPNMGWQTCERAAKIDCSGPECSSRSAYFKFFWSDLQWAPGAFDFTPILEAAAKAAERGQQLDLRPVMPYAPEQSAPYFLQSLGALGEDAVYDDGESRQQFWMVDLNDFQAREAYVALIRELGQQFDQDPRIGIVDISVFGLWGEGHIGEVWPSQGSGTRDEQEAFAQNYALRNETRQMLVDAYFEAFPHKLKVAQITDVETLHYAVSRGSGIRLDCLGGYFMESNYPRLLEEAYAADTWKTAPVVAEVCGSLPSWAAQWGPEAWQYNEARLDEIFTRAETLYHLSSLNAKNSDEGIPDQIQPRLFQFLQKLGYRFELREVSNQALLARGENLTLQLSFTNSGIAPSYIQDQVVAIRLSSSEGENVFTYVGSNSIAGHVPGDFIIEESVPVPSSMQGHIRVAIGIVDISNPSRAVVPLAISGGQDNWYEVTGFDVEEAPAEADRKSVV